MVQTQEIKEIVEGGYINYAHYDSNSNTVIIGNGSTINFRVDEIYQSIWSNIKEKTTVVSDPMNHKQELLQLTKAMRILEDLFKVDFKGDDSNSMSFLSTINVIGGGVFITNTKKEENILYIAISCSNNGDYVVLEQYNNKTDRILNLSLKNTIKYIVSRAKILLTKELNYLDFSDEAICLKIETTLQLESDLREIYKDNAEIYLINKFSVIQILPKDIRLDTVFFSEKELSRAVYVDVSCKDDEHSTIKIYKTDAKKGEVQISTTESRKEALLIILAKLDIYG